MKIFKYSFILTLLLTISIGANAQYKFYNEIGGSVGPALTSGDWGRSTAMGKVFGYDGVEANFLHNMQVIRERVGLRSNLGLLYTQNKHNYDEWTGEGEFAPPSAQQEMLAAMSGTSMVISLGTQIEYNFFDFGMYYPRASWTPYISVGFNLLYYMNHVKTPLGIPNAYKDKSGITTGIYEKAGLTSSFKGSLGAKYKLSRYITIFGELSFQRAFSDKVDGLVPQASFGTDYLNSLNLGLMYAIK